MSRVSSPSTRTAQAPQARLAPKTGGGREKLLDDHADEWKPSQATVPAAAAGVQKPAGVPSSVFEAGRLAKPAAAPRRAPKMLDLDAVVIETGHVFRQNPKERGQANYEKLLARMSVGSSVVLTHGQAVALQAVGKKHGVKVRCNRLADGRSRAFVLGAGEP